MGNKKKYRVLLCMVLVLGIMASTFSPVYAWKPKTHVFTANLILEEIAANNGAVVFPAFGPIQLPAEYLTALQTYPDYFRAGAIGPDGFPDIYVGQVFAHPKTKLNAGEWIKYLFDELSKLPAGSEERKQVLAFALGYTVHASGDLFGHSFVNEWSKGAWPVISDADGLSMDDRKIIVRHNAVEGYIDNQLPAQYTTAAYNNITSPKKFIYNHFITNGKPANYDYVGSDALDISPFYARTGDIPKHFKMFYDSRRELKAGIGTRAEYNPIRIYQEFWLEDIDDGMKAWVDTSEDIAQDLLRPTDGFTKAKEHLSEWAIHHLLSMVGFPEVVGWVVGGISDLGSLIEEVIPDWAEDIIKDMKNSFYDVIFMWTFNMKYTELLELGENPAKFLNDPAYFPVGSEARLHSTLNNLSSGTTVNRITFHPIDNTITMAKLNLIGQSGMEQLLKYADMEYLGTSTYPPICFIKSLDVGYDWNDIHFTGLSIWDDHYAREKIFNQIFDAETSKYQWYTKNERLVLDAYTEVMSAEPDAANMNMYSQLMDGGWTQNDVKNDLRQRMLVQTQLDDYRKKTEITEESLTQDTIMESLNPGYGRTVYKILNLNGNKLTVNCNLEIDRMGMINVSGGTLVVNGDLMVKSRSVIINNILQGGVLSIDGGKVIVKGNLICGGGLINVDKGNLTIEGDLEQSGGLLDVNEGKVDVRGIYGLSFITKPRPGSTGVYATQYSFVTGAGVLKMENDADHVVVGKAFVTTTRPSHENYLTAGTLEVKGDFYQAAWGAGCKISGGAADLRLKEAALATTAEKANFKATARHRVLLSGNSTQNVGMATTSAASSQFSILEITNPTEVKFVTKVIVAGLFKHNGKRFTLSDAAGSFFSDYDGDGVKDNVDSTPCPTGQDPIKDDPIVPAGSKGTIGIYNPSLPKGDILPRLPKLPGFTADTGSDPSARLIDPIFKGTAGTTIKVPPTTPGTGTTTPATPATIYKAPGNLKAIPGENSVTLQWDDMTSKDVIGYKLYRQEGSDNYTPVVDLIIEDNSYTDEGVIAGNMYNYICKTVYTGGKESEPSNQVSATPYGFETPGLSASLQNGKVVLELPDLTKADAIGYNIYKGTKPGEQGANPINRTPITTSEYIDSSIGAGTTYYYVCTIVYDDGSESETSAEVSVVIPGLQQPTVLQGINVTLQIGKPTISINGNEAQIETKAIKPIDVKGTFMAPARVFEAFGAKITDNAKLKNVTIELGKTKITATQGSTKVTVNGAAKTLPAAPQLVDGRLMVPVQFIAESLGWRYSYNTQTKTVTLTK